MTFGIISNVYGCVAQAGHIMASNNLFELNHLVHCFLAIDTTIHFYKMVATESLTSAQVAVRLLLHSARGGRYTLSLVETTALRAEI
jgi:hypothetical protein